jgi:hypothetical protein
MSKHELIYETIITTRRADGTAHIVPLGIRYQDDFVVLAPFRPSATLDNVLRERCAVINFTDDARIFAGCLSGHSDWPTIAGNTMSCVRLADSLAHTELELARIDEDELRPRLFCRVAYAQTHGPFRGFNRAQAAVVEACILVSRLHMLPQEKIRSEIDYLSIAVAKTAGPKEQQAWEWLMQKIDAYYATQEDKS